MSHLALICASFPFQFTSSYSFPRAHSLVSGPRKDGKTMVQTLFLQGHLIQSEQASPGIFMQLFPVPPWHFDMNYRLLHCKNFLLRHCGYFEAYLVVLSRFNFPSLKFLVIPVSSPNEWLFSFVYFCTVTEKHSVHGLLIFSFLISSYSSISLQVWQSFSHFALCVLGVGTSIFTWENFVYS